MRRRALEWTFVYCHVTPAQILHHVRDARQAKHGTAFPTLTGVPHEFVANPADKRLINRINNLAPPTH
jgi:hypothetical protein